MAKNVEVLDFQLFAALVVDSVPMDLAVFPMVHATELYHALVVLLNVIIAEGENLE